MLLHLYTSFGFLIKNIIEIFRQNFKGEICLRATADGLFSEQITSDGKRKFQFKLFSGCVEEYTFTEEFTVGIDLQILYNSLKSVKKRDSLVLNFNNDSVEVITISNNKNRSISCTIATTKVQEILIDPIEGYTNELCLNMQDFNKLYREISSFSNDVVVEIFANNSINFKTQNLDFFDHVLSIGNSSGQICKYSQSFPNNFLHQLGKLNYLSSLLRISYHDKLPLKLECAIGEIGKFSYFTKGQ